MKLTLFLSLFFALTVNAQSTPAPAADPFQSLSFLAGNWEAKAAAGSAGATANGTYTFGPELRNHVFARHTVNAAGCKGPVTFDCQHGDLLYIYGEGPKQSLKAIYFDNEGHVIHYNVSTPSPATAIFLSDASQPGPQFRLIYELKDQVMYGKFQMLMPGQTEWKSYLEWSGGKVK